METFSLGFEMKMPKGYCAKIYERLGMTVKHGIHLPGFVSIIDPDLSQKLTPMQPIRNQSQ